MNLSRIIKIHLALNDNINNLTENQIIFIRSFNNLKWEHFNEMIYYYFYENDKKVYLYKLDLNSKVFYYSWINIHRFYKKFTFNTVKQLNRETKELLSNIIPDIKIHTVIIFHER